ncbi:hypothetical protein A7P25_19005 [Achromobacter xylosoxidans]|nr:hypothetical protein A7P25_19005 [Achromobacter xylosoxidans]
MKTTVLILCAFLAGVAVTMVATPSAEQDVMACRRVEGNTIDLPGTYCLSETRRGGLTIKASDVSLDLRGYCILSPEGKSSTDSGIELAPGASRVSITGGCIQGFFYGIRAEDAAASDIRVTGVSFSGQTFRGVSFRPQKVVIKNNLFKNIGGTTVYPDAYAMAIEIHGRECKVSDNQIINFYPTGVGEGVGISISDHDNDTCKVTRNVIRNDGYPKAGRTFGIWSSNNSATVDNVIINMTYGIAPNYTKGNYIIDEACDGLNFAETPDDDYDATTSRVAECQDRLETALQRFRADSPQSAFRVGQIYEMQADYVNAMAYYGVAAALGSQEAQRLIDVYIIKKYQLDQAGQDKARAMTKALLSQHVTR